MRIQEPSGFYGKDLALTATLPYSAQMRVRNDGSCSATLSFGKELDKTIPNDGFEYLVQLQNVLGSALYGIYLSSDDGSPLDVTITDEQLEQKAYCTSLTPPNTTRANEVVTLDTYVPDTVNPTNILSERASVCGEDGYTTGWIPNMPGTILRSDNTWAVQGSRSIKVACDGTSGGQGADSEQFAVKAGQTYTASVMAKGTGNVRLTAFTAGAPIGTNIALSETPTKLTCTFTATVDEMTRVAIFPLNNQVCTFWLDALQVEPGTRAGSWVPGQTRRLLDATGGTIEVECMITDMSKRQDGQYNVLFSALRASDGLDALFMYHNSNSAAWYIHGKSDTGNGTSTAFADNTTPNGKRKIAVTYVSGGDAVVKVDGVIAATRTAVNLPSTFSAAKLGANYAGARFANTIFTRVSFYDHAGNLTQTWDLSGPKDIKLIREGGF